MNIDRPNGNFSDKGFIIRFTLSKKKLKCQIWGSIKTKCISVRLRASKCSQTVALIAYVGNCHTCSLVDVNDSSVNDGRVNDCKSIFKFIQIFKFISKCIAFGCRCGCGGG